MEAALTVPVTEGWSERRKFAFRFGFALASWVGFPFPLDSLPMVGTAIRKLDFAFEWLTGFCAAHVFGVTHPLRNAFTGSSDKLYDWMWLGTSGLVALAAAFVWSIADRRRSDYARLSALLHVYLRYLLAAPLFFYGLSKLLRQQFPPPSNFVLQQTYGESSPMRLLWTLMGASAAYQFFSGFAEAVPAVLLLFRRTATLGALLGAGVMLNVVLLNFCFDVPVKIYSTTLFLIAVAIASPDLPRLLRVFVLNKAADPAPLDPALLREHPRLRLGLKMILIALVFGPILQEHVNRGRHEARPPWVGWYQVDAFDGPVARKWVVAELTPYFFLVKRADGTKDRFGIRSFENGKLALSDRFRDVPVSNPELQADLRGGELKLSGELAGEKISATLKRTDPPTYLLTTRGFHWVNEVPYNK